MNASWAEVRRLAEEGLALDGAARQELLERSCAGTPQLRAAVEALWREESAADAQLDGGALRLLAAQEALAEEEPPQRCGPFALGPRLGVGGSAAVYEGRTAEGRRVAVKWLHRALLHSEDRRRFEAEVDVLRTLDHPGLVRPETAGLADGCPYLVTELIEGLPIHRHCRERGLTREAILRLFLRLVEAVHHAHSRLVVHRDLKPSNVLVTAAGEPKVLDFGVAKLLDVPQGHTRPGRAAPHTPPYASPEQRRGDPVTTASDVYSLGVLLGELLTARPAADPPSWTAAGDLPADLRAVLRCATAPQARDRYPSAHALGEDLQRVLEHRPVTARRTTWVQRLLLWSRRQPLPAALCAASLLALIASGALTWQSVARLRASESVAWRAHAEAVLATQFWTELLGERTAGEAQEAATWEQSLSRATAAVDQVTAGAPEAEARLRLGLARLWVQQGAFDRAEPLARRAVELTADTRGLSPVDHRAALELLTEILIARRDPEASARATELLELPDRAASPSAAARERARTLLERARELGAP
jgi:hypothetical protein